MSEHTDGDAEQYPNPFLAASTLEPGRGQLDALRQFLEQDAHRLHEGLNKIENDDGSIPDDAAEQWSMTKGKLDQTRLIHGLVAQSLLADKMRQETDNE